MQTKPQLQSSSKDWLGLALILLSSLLLGIWAVKGTIALRNILLGLETIFSVYYCILFFKGKPKIPLRNWMPLIFLGLMFAWVIWHYLFFSRFPEQQFYELKSTWLRSFLAALVGIGTGLAIQKRPNAINLLWMGIIGSFLFLISQYIPKAIVLNSFFAPFYSDYIFYGKISGMLAGTILVSGLFGTMIDVVRRGEWPPIFFMMCFSLFGVSLALYSYVFIFNTQSGVGLTVILFIIFCLVILRQIIKLLSNKSSNKSVLIALLFIFIITAVMASAIKEHVKHSPGWFSLLDDVMISWDIETFSNWQDPLEMGYPRSLSGQVVRGNTYERIAWATAGVSIFLSQNPLGVGIMKNPFTMLMLENFPTTSTYFPSTHSAWVEIGLSFGYPGIFLLLGALVLITTNAICSRCRFQSTALMLSIGLIMIYAVGEVSSQHAIEMLCFLISATSALLIPQYD